MSDDKVNVCIAKLAAGVPPEGCASRTHGGAGPQAAYEVTAFLPAGPRTHRCCEECARALFAMPSCEVVAEIKL